MASDSETRAASTVLNRGATPRRSLKHHLPRRPSLAVVVAALVVVVVARLVHLATRSNSTSNAAASKSQSLRFPQARTPAFSARLHYQHGAVQHVFTARPPHAEHDWQRLWEPRHPMAAIDIPPAGVLSFHRRNGSSGRLVAANASSFCLTDDSQACTDWSRVELDVSLEAALQHLRESGACPRVRQKGRALADRDTVFFLVQKTPLRKPLSAYPRSRTRTLETHPSLS